MVNLKLPKGRNSLVYANPLKRITAFLLDFLLLYFIVIDSFASYFVKIFPKESASFKMSYSYALMHQATMMHLYYAIIAMMAIIWFYFSFMQYKYSQTVGMMFFGLFVESTVSKELTFWQCAIRNIYLLPLFPIYLIWVISPIYYLFKGERMLEMLSKTKTTEVIKYGY